MNVELKVSIDLTDSKGVEALTELLRVASGVGAIVAKEEPTTPPTEEKAPTKRRTTKKVAEEPKKEEAKEAPTQKEETSPKTEAKTEVPSVKIEDLRALLQTKVAEHRDAIKGKLTELGAGNISSLDLKHYEEFFTFLNSL